MPKNTNQPNSENPNVLQEPNNFQLEILKLKTELSETKSLNEELRRQIIFRDKRIGILEW